MGVRHANAPGPPQRSTRLQTSPHLPLQATDDFSGSTNGLSWRGRRVGYYFSVCRGFTDKSTFQSARRVSHTLSKQCSLFSIARATCNRRRDDSISRCQTRCTVSGSSACRYASAMLSPQLFRVHPSHAKPRSNFSSTCRAHFEAGSVRTKAKPHYTLPSSFFGQ